MKGEDMNYFKSFFIVLCSTGFVGCASVGGVWQAGTEVVTGTVDAVVGGVTTVGTAVADDVVAVGTLAVDTAQTVVVTAVETGKGVAETINEEVDRQTDELQPKEEEEAPKKD